MRSMKRRVAVLLFAVVAAVGLGLVPAGAGESHHGKRRPLVVDDDYGRHHHARCQFGPASFPTISAAVAVAHPGATILVCPGLYQETVEVRQKGLTILGARFGQDARGRDGDGKAESVVEAVTATAKGVVQLLGDGITWDGFVIRGLGVDDPGHPRTSPGMYTAPNRSGYSIRNTVFLENGLGIHLGSDGTRPTTICQNHFVANNEFEGPGAGNAIYSDEGASQVLILENRFEDHNGAAILFADEAPGRIRQQDIRVEGNKSIDDRTFAAFYATSRLRLVANWAKARVDDPRFPGDANRVSAIFIGARNHDVVVKKNRVASASGNGIDVTSSPEPNHRPPLGPAAPRNVVVAKNRVGHVQRAGLHLATGARGVLVRGNTALDNQLDCQDEAPRAANRWEANLGRTSQPSGLCSPPTGMAAPGHASPGGHHRQRHQRYHGKPYRPNPCAACGLPRRY
jgi:Right handed beta helix region